MFATSSPKKVGNSMKENNQINKSDVGKYIIGEESEGMSSVVKNILFSAIFEKGKILVIDPEREYDKTD